ncbi:hypothetical protein NFI96_003196 [Prochilodus magdalenae]|nr:hypothetical protein NFI96_003196 [Prochilodus magdalenae]
MSGKNKSKNNPDKTKVNPGQAKANSNMLDDDPDSITALRNTMEGISKQIQALQTDLKADLRAFKDDITTQVKREVSELRADIDQKFATVSTDIQQQSERINANQARTEEVEAWSAEANTVFLELLREQRRMIEKLDDLERPVSVDHQLEQKATAHPVRSDAELLPILCALMLSYCSSCAL